MSLRRTKARPYISQRSYASVRRRAPKANSLILRHYALFTSLSRYARSPSHTPPPEDRDGDSRLRTKASKNKPARIQQRYAAGPPQAQKWPLPPARFPPSDRTAQEDLDRVVEDIVRETFDRDYEKFRSLEWGRKHKIRKEHRQRIIVDDQDVKVSAQAAKAEVHKALNTFINAVKRREIGSSPKGMSGRPNSSSAGQAEQPSDGSLPADGSNMEQDVDIDDGLDQEIFGEAGDPGKPKLGWKELLDFFQASSGTSRSAQWRHWHLLNAVNRTRQRCEELFPHEAD